MLKKYTWNGASPSLIRFVLCFLSAVLLCSVILSALPVHGEEAIYENVVRLHVLANSDTAEDQALKLQVRDAVLLYLQSISAAAETAADARQDYSALLPAITEVCEETIAAAGYAYPCQITLTEEYYPERTYEKYTFPAGTYTSLRILIGEADGQNWWCVLFPPLCLGFSSETVSTGNLTVDPDSDELLLSAGFTPYEVSLLSEASDTHTVMKFRIVEFLRQLFVN